MQIRLGLDWLGDSLTGFWTTTWSDREGKLPYAGRYITRAHSRTIPIQSVQRTVLRTFSGLESVLASADCFYQQVLLSDSIDVEHGIKNGF